MRKCAGGKKPRSDHFGDASPPSLSLRPRSLLMTLNSEAKYSSGGGRAPRGSSIRRLPSLSKSLLTRRDVKRSNVSPPPQKRKREKKKKNEDTSLFLLSLSLSPKKKTKTKTKTRTKGRTKGLFLLVLSSFFLRCVGRGKKGRRGFSKGRRNEEKACGSLNVLFLSFFSSKVLVAFFRGGEAALKSCSRTTTKSTQSDFLSEPLFRLRW